MLLDNVGGARSAVGAPARARAPPDRDRRRRARRSSRRRAPARLPRGARAPPERRSSSRWSGSAPTTPKPPRPPSRRSSRLRSPPTAIFTGNNRITVGALRRARREGRRVALVGFDDLELAELLAPPTTVVAYDAAELGRKAAELVLRRLAGDDATAATRRPADRADRPRVGRGARREADPAAMRTSSIASIAAAKRSRGSAGPPSTTSTPQKTGSARRRRLFGENERGLTHARRTAACSATRSSPIPRHFLGAGARAPRTARIRRCSSSCSTPASAFRCTPTPIAASRSGTSALTTGSPRRG